MVKYLFYISLLLAGMGCSKGLILTGKYASKYNSKKNSPYGFNINTDSTFSYSFYQFHVYEYSVGKWYRKKNKEIILNSTIKDASIPLFVTESPKLAGNSENRFSFEFNSNGIAAKDCECTIIINDTIRQIRRCDSIALVEVKVPVSRILVEVRKSPLLFTVLRFSLNPLISNVYSVPEEFGNFTKFKIVVNDSLFSYKIFDNKRIKVNKKGIYLYEDKGCRKHWIPRLKNDSSMPR